MEEKKRDWKKYYNPEVQNRAQRKYDAEHTRQVVLKLNLKSDADVLSQLDSVPNKQGYIKELIRQDMAKGRRE